MATPPNVEIVVCVHNALEVVQRCLQSVLDSTMGHYRLVVVNDASDAPTTAYLRQLAARHPETVHLIENPENRGYTASANIGLKTTTAAWVVLLNSDTEVAPMWLPKLLTARTNQPSVGLIGPLSNAASWQSVPERWTPEGDWAVNPLPDGLDVAAMAAWVTASSAERFPRVPLLNGFCLAIGRQVIDAIGYFDEAAFPHGYGEENDYCLRATRAGFECVIADQSFVYHAKSQSFGHERRRELSRAGNEALVARYGADTLQQATETLKHHPVLAEMRARLSRPITPSDRALIAGMAPPPPAGPGRGLPPETRGPRLLFVLPVNCGGGGVHSIVQEAHGMRRLGVPVQVAVPERFALQYQYHYADLPGRDEVFAFYPDDEALSVLAAAADGLIATANQSMETVAQLCERHPHLRAAYYVQDYEPWFFEPGTPEFARALASYERVPGCVMYAKTDWLCREVSTRHGVTVHKVSPSLDTDVFYPHWPEPPGDHGCPLRVVAMVRPNTPRRSPALTMRVLKALQAERPAVEMHLYGLLPYQLQRLEDERDFEFRSWGLLTRRQVAHLYRHSDIFVDFSTYQAFGRTGLEAMACGAAVIVPAAGGADEYARHGVNTLQVDTASEAACLEALRTLIDDTDLRRRLQTEGLRTASAYSVHRAVVSELQVLAGAFQRTPTRLTAV